MYQLLKIVNTGKIIALDSDTGEISDVEVVTGFVPALMTEKKQEIQQITKKHSKEKTVKKPVKGSSDRWARDYDCCRECLTTSKKHAAGGLCKDCYVKKLRSKNKTKSEKPAGNQTFNYECFDCGKILNYSHPVDVTEARCPEKNCGGRLIQTK